MKLNCALRVLLICHIYVFYCEWTRVWSVDQTFCDSLQLLLSTSFSILFPLLSPSISRLTPAIMRLTVYQKCSESINVQNTRTYARTHARDVMSMLLMHRSAKCLWSFYSYSYYDAHTHRAPVHSLSAWNYGAHTFQVLNSYREIILCVVTCCVYNYLFLHDGYERKTFNNQSSSNNNNVKRNMVSFTRCAADTQLRLLRVGHLSSLFSNCFEFKVQESKRGKNSKWINSMYNLNITRQDYSQYQFQFHGEFSIFRARFLNKRVAWKTKLLLKC